MYSTEAPVHYSQVALLDPVDGCVRYCITVMVIASWRLAGGPPRSGTSGWMA